MNPLLQALEYVGSALDKPGRSIRGGLAGRPDELAAIIPFSDTLELTDPSRAVSGTDLLRGAGLGTGSDTADAVLGFGAEMALDPTNLIGLGAVGKTARLAGEARAANAVRDALLAKGAMPEEIAALTKAVDESGKPMRMLHGTAAVYDRPDLARATDARDLLYGPGYYTTENPRIAGEYAEASAAHGFPRATNDAALAGAFRDAVGALDDTAVQQYDLWTHRPYLNMPDPDVARSAVRYAGRVEGGYVPPNPVFERINPFVARARPNTRMQYLDVRNPFDPDAAYTPEQVRAIFANSPKPADQLLSGVSAKGLEAGQPVPGEEIYDALTDALYPDRRGDKALANELLRKAGYDSITHVGGKVTGGQPHRVFIAFDPSQVYRPWLAPAARDVPSMNPLLAGLAGYNAAEAAY